MISKDIDATNLQNYYDQLCQLQSEAHKSEYILVHDEIKSKLNDCNSYTEFGINQGTTLAIPILNNIKKVRGYDINLTRYNKAKHHFDDACKLSNIDFKVYQENTLNVKIDLVDLLYIDSLHDYNHLSQELKLHGNKVQKYIIFHDTEYAPTLKKAIQEYINNNSNWTIINQCEINVGFITIKKTK